MLWTVPSSTHEHISSPNKPIKHDHPAKLSHAQQFLKQNDILWSSNAVTISVLPRHRMVEPRQGYAFWSYFSPWSTLYSSSPHKHYQKPCAQFSTPDTRTSHFHFLFQSSEGKLFSVMRSAKLPVLYKYIMRFLATQLGRPHSWPILPYMKPKPDLHHYIQSFVFFFVTFYDLCIRTISQSNAWYRKSRNDCGPKFLLKRADLLFMSFNFHAICSVNPSWNSDGKGKIQL